jgi:hypothetical protein
MYKIAISLKDPSTWAGIIGLMTLIGINLDPELTLKIAEAGASVASLLAIVLTRK